MVRPPAEPSISSAPDTDVPEDTTAMLYALLTLFAILSLLVIRQNLGVGLFALAATAVIFWPVLQPAVIRLRWMFVRR